ncbi:MAG TPA: alpha/beta hydrolase [Alphaproteobacteria bacterium]|jgi:3-oxoadipate enol-lactonase|nr:alpha/beta hydrolase [Alphaproteobacteria bacterium]HBF99161.1 alpha/beta hydrolase [Alphaproteobacteria bacterium]
MPFVSVRDITLYYEMAGSGARLLFINGTGGDLRARPNIFQSPLGDRFTLLAHDQRGLGQSDKPDCDYRMEDYADDAAALMTAVGWDRAHVFGVSFGGMVAQHLALRHPERIDRLVLACTSAGGAGGASYPLHELQDMPPAQRAQFLVAINDTRHDAAWQAANPDTLRRMIDFRLAMGELSRDDPLAEKGAARQLNARAGHDTYERLHRITCPVFLCGGRYDGLARPENMTAMAARIPNAELRFFEGGHLFLLQDAAAYPAIAEFLRDDDAQAVAG